MKKYLYLWLLLSTVVIAENSDLKGKLVNKQNQGVGFVTIKIKDTSLKVISDKDGDFIFKNIPNGEVELDIEMSNTQHFNTVIKHQKKPIVINVDSIQLDEIVVSALPLEHSLLDMTVPVAIISEEEMIIKRGASIDQTLNQITGVNSGSFGQGAGQIVIRGQQGPRVTVLNNNQTLQDASRVSPDHWVSTEPLLIEQIEVLKGPATLLYGGGAIGGVVNVIDDVIPTSKINGIEGALEGRLSDSTLSERSGVLSINAGLSNDIMSHFSYFDSSTDNYEIPGSAESEILHEAEEHGEEEHEEEDLFGVLENSSIESNGFNVGFSWVNDKGYWGLSYSDFDRNYGLPGHSHDHEHDDEHEGDDGHEGDDDHDGDDNHHDDEEEEVRLILDKSLFVLKGSHTFENTKYINSMKTHFTNTDYQHVEFEGNETGTVFDNQATEFRYELSHHKIAGLRGIAGIQYTQREFSAIGEEAFILPSTTNTLSLFLIEEKQFDGWHGEMGLRFEDQKVKTTLFNDISDQALSLSLGAVFNINKNWTLPIHLTSAQRLPTAEEYFSNQGDSPELITHLATSLIEVGDIDLKHETANNLDIGLKYRSENIRFDAALFYNQLDDYIFLKNTGTFFEETPIFQYSQQNTTFMGYELDFEYLINTDSLQQWRFKLFADGTRAELNTSEDVPRIPADRLGAGINWHKNGWSFGLNHSHVMRQNAVANLELPTESYNLLDFNLSWLHLSSNLETLIFIKGNNMLDEEIRDHASFIKDLAPRPGRSLTAGFRIMF